MRLISVLTHPTRGRCYLWEKAPMDYYVGKVNVTWHGFNGYTLDEVKDLLHIRKYKIETSNDS